MQKVFILFMALLLSCCSSSFAPKVIWEGEVNSFYEIILLDFKIPEDIGIVLIASNGYSVWNEVLMKLADLEIAVEMIDSEDVSIRYMLSIKNPSENCRLMQVDRPDGKLDLGWRLVNKSKYLKSIKIEIINNSGMMISSTRVRLIKLK